MAGNLNKFALHTSKIKTSYLNHWEIWSYIYRDLLFSTHFERKPKKPRSPKAQKPKSPKAQKPKSPRSPRSPRSPKSPRSQEAKKPRSQEAKTSLSCRAFIKFRFISPSHLPILRFAFMPLIYLSIHIGVQNQNVYKLKNTFVEILATILAIIFLATLAPILARPPWNPQKALAQGFMHLQTKLEYNPSTHFVSRWPPLKCSFGDILATILALAPWNP